MTILFVNRKGCKKLSTNTFTIAAATAILASNDFWYMHLYSKDSDFDKSHRLTEQYYERLSYEADDLMELAVEVDQPIFNPSETLQILPSWIPERQNAYDYDTIVSRSKMLIVQHITALKAMRSSTDRTDIQSRIDEMLAYWEKELNYKLARRTPGLSMLNGFVDTGLDNALAYTLSRNQ